MVAVFYLKHYTAVKIKLEVDQNSTIAINSRLFNKSVCICVSMLWQQVCDTHHIVDCDRHMFIY